MQEFRLFDLNPNAAAALHIFSIKISIMMSSHKRRRQQKSLRNSMKIVDVTKRVEVIEIDLADVVVQLYGVHLPRFQLN
jgi:hypothetical protein